MSLQGEPDNVVEVGVGLSDPTLSFGLSAVNDYTTSIPFLDLMKMSRPMFGYTASTWESLTHEQMAVAGYFDDNGWPTEIPEGMKGVRTHFGYPAGTAGAEGPFVLTWEGEGTIKLGSATVVGSGDHRIVFTNPDGGAFQVEITVTDPNDNGNYIKNISIVPEKYEGLAALGELFNPDWLAVVEDSRQLRFMNWMLTNNSVQSEWVGRPEVGDITWQGQGVPVEVIVQLANQTGTDPWFNIPHLATDEYVEQFAAYVSDHLAPALKAHFEYSNELWNSAFDQTDYTQAQGAAADWTTGTAFDKNQQWVGYRSAQVMEIVRDAFGEDSGGRWAGVLSTWPGSTTTSDNRLAGIAHHVSADSDVPEDTAVSDLFSAVATTTYFGTSVVSNAANRTELLAHIATHSAEETYDWLAGKLTDPAYSSSIPLTAKAWIKDKAFADAQGLDLIAYEGGQHVHQSFSVSGLSAEDLTALTSFMTGFVRSEQMAALYETLWDAWSEVSDGPFMQFGDVGQSTKYGTWALLQSLGDTNPRADLLFELNETVEAWFGDGGGTRYQQGVIKLAGDTGETVTGTNKDDFLVGGDGNDIFIPGSGNDRINGGKGNDTIVLPGGPNAYTLIVEQEGYHIRNAGMSTSFEHVEHVRFDTEDVAVQDLARLVPPYQL